MDTRYCLLAAALTVGLWCASASPAIAAENDAITITPADFKIPRDKILDQVTRLESLAEVSVATADYARAFNKLQDDLGKATPPLKEWSEKDVDRVKALKEPSSAAWEALRTENSRLQNQRNARAAEAAMDHAALLQQRQAEQKAQLEADRLAQEARLKEAQIRESEARTDYYEDSYPFYGNRWWYNPRPGPWRPRPTVPRDPKDIRYSTENAIISKFRHEHFGIEH